MDMETSGTPLSAQQELIRRSFGSSALPVAQCVVHFIGAISHEQVLNALRRVVETHEVLRTRLSSDCGDLLQAIADPGEIEWQDYPPSDALDVARNVEFVCSAECRRRFNHDGDALFRAAFLRNTQDTWLVLTASALLMDSASWMVLFDELAACLNDRPGSTKPHQFSEYCAWQAALLSEDGLDEDPSRVPLEDWNSAPALHLPSEDADPSAGTGDIRYHALPLKPQTLEKLRVLCEEEDLDAEAAMLAFIQTVLARITGLSSFVMGYIADGRTLAALQSCLGVLSKALPLRAETPFGDHFVSHARAASLAIEAIRDCQDTHDVLKARPVDEGLQPDVFACCRGNVFHPVPGGAMYLERCYGVCDSAAVKWIARIDGEGVPLGFSVLYRTSHLSAAMLEALVPPLIRWLDAVLSEPRVAIGRLGLLDPVAERNQFPPRGGVPDARPVLLHSLVSEWVRDRPDSIAIVEGDQRCSFRSLDERSDALAAALVRSGVVAGDFVALLLPRSTDFLTSALGVHKTGAAYLPLDPQHPAGRLSRIAANARPSVVLTRRALADMAAQLGQRVVFLDDIGPASGTFIRVDVPADAAAYVLYTSGSTGEPKGVVVSHRSLSDYLQWADREYPSTGPCDSVAHTSAAVDLSVTALFLPLIRGRYVNIVPDAEGVDGLFALLRREESCGVLKLTPTHAAMLTSLIEQGSCPRPRPDVLILGGEELRYEHVTGVADPAVTIIVNEYGPTEATVGCCAFRLRDSHATGAVPIGMAMAGAELYVVDDAMNPVPRGVTGELLIAGPCLAMGYLGKPAATADAFRPNPFTDQPGGRVYRTGDLAICSRSGHLEHRGRRDQQIKLRGHRVELGEIEAVLARHPDVAHAVATVHGDGEQMLVSYVVPREGRAISATQLRALCREHLPDAMVPACVISLDRMPLTASGKVDRRALPRPDTRKIGRGEYVAPRDDLERDLAGIWEAELRTSRVGVSDDFFELGGHSMLAIRILFAIRKQLSVELDLADLFEHPTVQDLAARIREIRFAGPAAEPQRLPQVVADDAGRHEPFPLTDVQQAYWVGQSDGYALGNVGAHVYQETEFHSLDLALLQQSFRKLIERHDMLRVVILPNGTQQVLRDVPPYEIEIFDLRGRSRNEQEPFILSVRERMSHQVFDLGRWPLFAVSACLIDDLHVRLHLSFDALIADAWSFEILLRDFSTLYQRPHQPLPPLSVRFRDYVMTTVGMRDTPLYLAAESYWKHRIAELPPAPQLPRVRQLKDITQPRFERRRHIVPEARWSAIKRHAADRGLTPSSLMLAAFGEVLARWSKSQRFTIVLTVFHRPPLHAEIDDIVGDFTSLVLMDFHPADGTFGRRALDVQKLLMERLEHRYYSGVRVLRELARGRTDQSEPLMPVVFTSTLTHRHTEEAAFLKSQQVEALGINQTPQVYLDHQLIEQNGELQFNWDSVEGLFPPGLLDSMFATYCAFVDRLEQERTWEQPADLLSRTDYEAYRLLNQTTAPVRPRLAIESILEHASRRPGAVALATADREISFAQLTGQAWQIAHALRAKGVAPNDVVGVLLEKGWQQVVAVLGVVFSGAAYLPLDPEAPAARVAYMLTDAGAGVVLTTTALAGKAGASVTCLPVDEPAWYAARPASALSLVQAPGDLAYVIYTSGSTGDPKGVMIEHRSLDNRLRNIEVLFGLGASDRALALTSLHHDLSVFDIFGVLGAGGALVVPAAPRHRDPQHWSELVESKRVTLWNSVPAFLGMYVEWLSGATLAPDPHRGAGLKILLSGDKVSPTLIRRAREVLPGAQYFSLGGPTETTVWDIWHPIGEVSGDEPRLPYGKPLTNARYYVLNEAGQLCPPEVPGELCIAGEGLARGYRNDPTRSAARFIHHAQLGERLYRSGDLGKLRSDSLGLDILGRIDLQVKINGQRIELEEIELTLEKHPAVKRAAVSVQRDDTAVWLAAHVELREGPAAPVADMPAGPKAAEEGMLLDPIERIQMKLEQRALRRDLAEDAHTVSLERPVLSAAYLKSVMRRRSERQFESDPIALGQFARCLSVLMQVMPAGFAMPKYQYPSAGNAYPLQVYLLVREGRIDGVAGGAYYYDPVGHRLISIAADGDWSDGLHAANNQPVSRAAAFSLFIVCEMAAIQPLYGELALRFATLEAGHMAQLLMSAAPDSQMGLCPVGTMDFESIGPRLKLGSSHELLHAFLGGRSTRADDDDPQSYLTDASKRWADSPATSGDISQSLKEFLAGRLPPHMVPDTYVLLEKLPLNANGKIDRSALHAGSREQRQRHVFVEPATPLEKALAQLWSEVLGVQTIGANDDFFQLGGDSILAIQLMNRLRTAFSLDIPLRDLLAATTVAQLATYLERRLRADVRAEGAAST